MEITHDVKMETETFVALMIGAIAIGIVCLSVSVPLFMSHSYTSSMNALNEFAGIAFALIGSGLTLSGLYNLLTVDKTKKHVIVETLILHHFYNITK